MAQTASRGRHSPVPTSPARSFLACDVTSTSHSKEEKKMEKKKRKKEISEKKSKSGKRKENANGNKLPRSDSSLS